MKNTQNLNMKIPEGGDPINITDITENFETLDTEIAKKASSSGGDISSMTIKTLDAIATDFPVPSAGESNKTFMGKVKKFIQDFNNFKTGILTLGRLVNNGQTTEPGFALDARYGKTLYDLYAQLNADMSGLINTKEIEYTHPYLTGSIKVVRKGGSIEITINTTSAQYLNENLPLTVATLGGVFRPRNSIAYVLANALTNAFVIIDDNGVLSLWFDHAVPAGTALCIHVVFTAI